MEQRSVALSTAKATLSELVDEVRTQRIPIVIKKHAKDVAVLVEIDQLRRWQQMEDLITVMRLKEALKGRKYSVREVLRELKIETPILRIGEEDLGGSPRQGRSRAMPSIDVACS